MGVRGRLRGVARRQGERVFVWLFVVVFLAVVGFLLYFGTPYHGTDASVQSVLDDDRIDVERSQGNYVLAPAGGGTERGLVFYPGARVHPDAYLASLAPLVRDGNTTVVVVKMPLNLAILNQGAGNRVIDRHAEIDRWYVGGHSLGGAMACRYARNNADQLEGVVLLGSYCDKSIADSELRVLSVAGEADTVLDRSAYQRNVDNLPADASLVSLPGVNHTQFGSYSGQPGDRPSGTPYATAHARLANVTVPWLANGSRGAR